MSAKLSLIDAKLVAKNKGGKCLSKRYINSATPMLWECKKGHTWRARYSSVAKRTWCPACGIARSATNRQKSISDAQAIAESKGGTLISRRMNGVDEKLRWRCAQGHTWAASYHMVSSETWCPKCAVVRRSLKQRKYSTDDAQRIIKRQKGVLLSGSVETSHSLLKVRCDQGHEFEINLKRLLRPNWCRKCKLKDFGGHNKYDLSAAQNLAISKGGKLISLQYVDSKSPLIWQCSKGHEWTTSFGSVKIHWCPRCQYQGNKEIASKRFGPKAMASGKAYAKARGGKLLTKEWPGTNKAKMSWECKEGHTWQQHLNSVISSSSWCPVCRSWAKEHLIKQAFEYLTGHSFPKLRISWMKSPKGVPLELDGYSEELKLAFEYNGPQHYKANRRFSANLEYIRQCDAIKRLQCRKKGIRLIIFRHEKQLEPVEIASRINQKLQKYGYPIVAAIENFQPNAITKTKLQEVAAIVKSKKGKLLEKTILNSSQKVKIRCARGHIWLTSLTQLKLGKWCQQCFFSRYREQRKHLV